MNFLKSSKFYWRLSIAVFIVLCFVAVFGLSISLQLLLAGIVATLLCVSFIISTLKYKRRGWWVAAIVSFWIGFMSVGLSYFVYTLPISIVATVLTIGFAVYAYIDFVRKGPYQLK